jgi:lysophospholipase L1-like esterase
MAPTNPKNEMDFSSSSTRKAIQWVTAWTAAPDSPGPSLKTQTIRQIIRTSIAGSKVRIRLSNLFGTTPVTFGSVHVAKHESGSAIKAGTDRTVTFGGKSVVTIAPGTEALSDPVALSVSALEQLAVSFYLPNGAATSTIHSTAIQTAFIVSGDVSLQATFPKGETDNSRYFLTDVEVMAKPGAQTILIVGDSITDGVGSTEDGNARWPDALAERLQSNPKLTGIAVANSGISGNRILSDGVEPYLGPSGLKRFERDALSKPNVRWILLFSGGNDISAPFVLKDSKANVSAEQIIEGMKTLIKRAHQKGIKMIGATLTPKGGSKFFFEEGEIKRQQVNSWIRTSGAFDAFVDFDKLIGDPDLPQRMLTAYDSGDHIHPNDAGYKKMAALIDLSLFASEK